ncbi:uncharacterized protein PGTG_21247 [Puccinia graminis f. sp. tritici CRL 75-36-700-3]|uniref:GATA-type domain-containing protein n=1 Tax=Puccinia graminis f. sp. tritici (strain CRL 75-36-700-3 / race SCCL) TaxID=418459 RepID=H6QQU5_PUCGT|nr:uncharacterized protein PGTG_21247 [Puccinia graminis f. sp. tritici CRL 75-36-700-3]EHS62874.1 hypothetical protein PGTG_21247 [Puccinia graminis f. sp. tritici CRL 75-36-700-3]
MADHHQKLNQFLSQHQQHTHSPPPSNYLNPNQPTATTPSRFLTSSPLPPPTSAYALVSLTRNLGTPTSDLRATSPSSNLNYPPDPSSDHQPINQHQPAPPSEPNSSSSPADWNHQQHPSDHHLFLHSDYLKPALPGVQNLLSNNHPSCFWAILDDQLKLVFLDPSAFPSTKTDDQTRSHLSLPLDQLIYPPHLDRIRSHLTKLSPRLPIPPNPPHPTDRSAALNPSPETLVGRSLCASRTPVRCSLLRHAQLGRLLLGTSSDSNSSSSYPTEVSPHLNLSDIRTARLPDLSSDALRLLQVQSDDRYHPTDLLLHPIPHGRFLAFFHSQQQPPRPESHGNPPYSPWITSTANNNNNNNTTPSSPCGHKELDPESNYLTREEIDQLHLALAHSLSTTPPSGFQPTSLERAASSQPGPLEIFLILDSRNARVLFSHHSPSTINLSDYQFAPEDYAYLAMQSKQHKSVDNEEGSAHSNCSRQLTAQHRLVKDSTVINIVQSFVIEYGSVTFASFNSSLPLSASRPQTMINQPQQQSTHSIMGSVKPSPLELVHDSRPIPLDLYSPTSSQLAHSAKRPRTDSSSEVLTPQSACSTQSQPYSYQRPSTHPGHQYSTFNSHHHHHHHHHPSPQLSSLTSSISMPESPDPYGGYGHFSGELSPTMASAANVLGSFHRAHYHHPQSILALQDSHHHHPHQISPASSTHHSSILGYENYGLQNLASMAASAPFDHPQSQPPPPPPDFSSQSSASSPHQPQSSSSDSYIIPSAPSSSQHLSLNNRSFRPPPNPNVSAKDSRLSTGSSSLPSPDPTTNESTLGCLVGLNHHHHHHHPSASNHEFGRPPPPPPPAELLSAPSYRSLTSSSSSVNSSSRDQQHPRSSSFIDNRFLKRPRSSQLDPLGSPTTTGTPVASTANVAHSDPAAVRSCTSCGAQNSPEWRKGPNGVKSLCNACGLRFSRAQARKSKAPKNSSNSASNQQQQQLKKQGHQLHQQQQQQAMIGKKKLVHALPPPPPPIINAPSPTTTGTSAATSAAAGTGTASLPNHLLLVNDDPRLIVDGFHR